MSKSAAYFLAVLVLKIVGVCGIMIKVHYIKRNRSYMK